MEKIVYVLWRPPAMPVHDYTARLLSFARTALLPLDLARLKVNVPDVAPPASDPYIDMKQNAPDGMVSCFLNSSLLRGPLERALAEFPGRVAGYAVAESTILPVTTDADGSRTDGIAQICFFSRKPGMTHQELLHVWLGSHTQVAVETQDTVYYNQNIVLRKLTGEAPDWDCIVEEHFAREALHDREVYFRARNAPAQLAANEARMNQSCERFIDFSGIKLLMSGEYRFGGWRDLATGWHEDATRDVELLS
jgi:hypothetical protein